MDHNDTFTNHEGGFPTTAWSLIEQVQGSAGDAEATDRLLRRYWKPVYGFLRARGYPVSQAEDLTQEFFLRLLERDWLRRADAGRGRFRTFMLTLLVRFLSDQGQHRVRRQQLFERRIVSVSTLRAEQPSGWEPEVHATPEAVFEKNWVQSLLEHACEQVRSQCGVEGRGLWYHWFEEHVLGDGSRRTSKSVLARRDGVSRDQVRYGVQQVKHRLDQTIRHELLRDGCSEEALEDEVRSLIETLGN